MTGLRHHLPVPAHVLIVDDNEADQFLCAHAIHEYDNKIDITKAFNGKEALDLLTKISPIPDLIFLDVNMPYMDGFDFLDHYHRFDGVLANIILMLTMSIDSNEANKGLTYSQVKKVVPKPLSSSVIADCFALLK